MYIKLQLSFNVKFSNWHFQIDIQYFTMILFFYYDVKFYEIFYSFYDPTAKVWHLLYSILL